MAKLDRKVINAVAASTDEFAESFGQLMRRKLAWVRSPAAWLSTRYGWGERKSKAIYRGELAPTGLDLLNLMAQDDDVFEWVIERTGRKLDWERERRAIKEILEGRH